jgi:hypothetical protein
MVAVEEPPKRKKVPGEVERLALLHGALARAQQDASAVFKDATNEGENYTYVKTEQLIQEGKRILPAHGLALFPRDSRLVTQNARTGSGLLETVWELTHEAGGSKELVRQWPVESREDRAFERVYATAHTSVLGYLLRDLLQIPRIEAGTDMDAAENNRRAAARARAAPTEPKPAPKPPAATAAPTKADAAATAALVAQITAEYDRLGVSVAERDATSRLVLGREPRTLGDLRGVVAALRLRQSQEPGGPLGPSAEKLERLERAWSALGVVDDAERINITEEILGPKERPSTSGRANVLCDELERRAAARAPQDGEAAHG